MNALEHAKEVDKALAVGDIDKVIELSRARGVIGTCYLLCFEPAFKHARHYLGWTSIDVDERLERHLSPTGRGSSLVHAAHNAGCVITIVRTWPNTTRHFERQLKNSKNTPRLCPRCTPSIAA